MTSQDDLDRRGREYYASGKEDVRLTRNLGGRLEFARTQELLAEVLSPVSRIYDVGGATGIHAAPLARAGHDVTLVDPVPEHVESARRHGTFEAVAGSALALPFADGSADAVLLLGPLYHLKEASDRLLALREARRVVRPGGLVVAAAITRLTAFTDDYLSAAIVADPARTGSGATLWAREWREILESGWTDVPGTPFPFGHFHTARELADEFASAGLGPADLHGVEGAIGLGAELLAPDDAAFDSLLDLARRMDRDPLRELSPHLLAVGRRPEADA